MSSRLSDFIDSGVVSGEKLQELFAHAKSHKYAVPAVNVVGTDSLNAVMEVY